MMSKKNAKHVVQLEVILIMTAMKRRLKGNAIRTYQEEISDPLYRNLSNLKAMLSQINDLNELKPLEYLSPFLDIISSGEMIGLITGLALTAVEKFLCFRYVDISMTNDNEALQTAIEAVANTVTNTKFVGTDHSSDEVILMKILRLLDTLMHVPVGYLITDYAVCKIISSCFRICFEAQLSELLRHTAECTLDHIVHLLFTRLPELKEDSRIRKNNLTISMDLSALSSKSRLRRKVPVPSESHSEHSQHQEESSPEDSSNPHTTLIKSESETPVDDIDTAYNTNDPINSIDSNEHISGQNENELVIEEPESQVLFDLTRNESTCNINIDPSGIIESSSLDSKTDDIQYRTEKGIVFKSDMTSPADNSDSETVNNKNCKADKGLPKLKILSSSTPYGLACVQKLLSNLILILSPENISHTNHVRTGLTLITAAFESGAEYISNFPNNLLTQIQNELSKNLILLLQSDRLSFFAASARVCFLMFESMRHHLKFQLEMYLSRLISIIMSDNENIPYEYREVALESIVQLWRIPSFITELYLNYDCDLYCSDLLQELAELFCKIATPDRSVRFLMNTQVVALDALLYMINSINNKKDDLNRAVYNDTESSETNLEKRIKLINPMLLKKRLLKIGTEKFNNDIKDGLKYLRSQGFYQTNAELALFFRENPRLNKAFIGEYICTRKYAGVREEYIKLFNCRGLRMDCAIRMFLEEFRLPGEAANIQLMLECFASEYFNSNPGMLSDLDSTFILLYAIVMLNVDQHNPNSKRQQAPMTLEQFKRNLWKSSEKRYYGNIDEETLNKIYDAIRTEEIVMPAEQRGIIKDNYLWKQLMRRCSTSHVPYYATNFKNHSYELFTLVWKSAVNAFVYVFEGEMDPIINDSMTHGLNQCASIAAYYNICEIMDKIIIYISKYTIFSSSQETVEAFGRNGKTKLAAKTMFHIAQKHGDILRDGWKNLLDCLLCLFKAKLLPKNLTEVDDFIAKDKTILLIEEDKSLVRTEAPSVINWFYSLTSSDYSSGQRNQEDELTKNEALNIINECSIPALIEETRFLKEASLTEFLNALINGTRIGDENLIKIIHHRQTQKTGQTSNVVGCDNTLWANGRDEQSRVFCLELMMRVLLHNSDRISSFLSLIHDHFYTVLIGSVRPDFLLERIVVACLRLTIQLLRKQEDADQVFTCLEILALTKNSVLKHVNLQVVCGLHDLIYMHAANIPNEKDWKLVLTLIEICGAGTKLDPIYKAEIVNRLRAKEIVVSTKIKTSKSIQDHCGVSKLSDHEDCHQEICNSADDIPIKLIGYNCDDSESGRGYTSDSELYKTTNTNSMDDVSHKWILVSPNEETASKNKSTESIEQTQNDNNVKLYSEYPLPIVNQYNIVLTTAHFAFKDPLAIEKSCEILSYLVRDPAHITPTNFEPCVHTLRVFAEACVKSSVTIKSPTASTEKTSTPNLPNRGSHQPTKSSRPRSIVSGNSKKPAHYSTKSQKDHQYSDIDSDDEPHYKVSAQIDKGSINETLLDLMHTLHNRADKIYFEWNKTGSTGNANIYGRLWKNCWCPLLQGMARLCCDVRPDVRTVSMTFLQRSLLSTVLINLTGAQWEDCFAKVLFPLLSNFLETIKNQSDSSSSSYNQIENSDPRMRAVQILTKVFLQHLGPLHEQSTFTALWLTILEYMDSFMRANNNSDSLDDAVRESLKNVLLVMYTGTQDRAILIKSDSESGQLLKLTCDRLSNFLPDLVEELFAEKPQPTVPELPPVALGEQPITEDSAALPTEEARPVTTGGPAATIIPIPDESDQLAVPSGVLAESAEDTRHCTE